MTSPEIPDSASPFWLRLYGKWVHLNGIMPVVDVEPQRAFNELTTVDGYRYVQAAPRGPRNWKMNYRWGTAAATAALESAAYAPSTLRNQLDVDLSTLLLDTNDARVNMVDPDIDTLWSSNFSGFQVINIGESPEQAIWKHAYQVDTDQTVRIPVRAGVEYSVALWVGSGVGAVANAITVTLITGAVDPVLATYAYPGGGTNENPVRAHVTFTPASDGVAEILLEWAMLRVATGLMVYEGDCPPDYYRNGRRTPCQVVVQDPSLTVNPIWSKKCSPCDLPREHAAFTILEVGVGMFDTKRTPA